MNASFFHGKDLRKGRVSIPGQIYHLTTITHGRIPVFTNFGKARVLVHVLQEVQELELAVTLAYVVMPDHLHWLMQLGSAQSLSRVIGTTKSLTARRIGRGGIWQPGFYDHALRREEDLVGVARYIVANPLRSGLVENIGQYPHWDAMWL